MSRSIPRSAASMMVSRSQTKRICCGRNSSAERVINQMPSIQCSTLCSFPGLISSFLLTDLLQAPPPIRQFKPIQPLSVLQGASVTRHRSGARLAALPAQSQQSVGQRLPLQCTKFLRHVVETGQGLDKLKTGRKNPLDIDYDYNYNIL